MMLGLKRGTVTLVDYQEEWYVEASQTIATLKQILCDIALDIQHIGSTSIPSISSKPIIDIVVGVSDLNQIKPYIKRLEAHNIIYRGSDVDNQLLFVIGDFPNDIRTHHIHVVLYKSKEWNNYINFRDYLNAFPERAQQYNNLKQELAAQFPNDRSKYTQGKQQLIETLLKEAKDRSDNNAF